MQNRKLENRQELSAILRQLDIDLSSYLKKISYKIVSSDNEINLGRLLQKYDGSVSVEDNVKNRFILVHNNLYLFRDNQLTAKRVLSLLTVKEYLLDELRLLKDREIDDIALQGKVDELKNKIQNAIEENMGFDVEHRKNHQTFQQNRLAGMGLFGSWCHESLHQSRAMKALEQAQAHLQKFEKQFFLTEEPRSRRSLGYS